MKKQEKENSKSFLVQELQSLHKALISIVSEFPCDKRETILFDKWSLKDVLAHMAGWNKCLKENLNFIQQNKEPPYFGKVNDFNAKAVKKSRKYKWEEVFKNFVNSGNLLVTEYRELPSRLFDNKFWPNKSSTPKKFLNIVIEHYEEHSQEVKTLLGRISTPNIIDYLFLKANKSIKKGEIIKDLGNEICDRSSSARLQVDETTFIKPTQCIQHSCNPNSFIDWKNNQLKALRDIKKDEVVTYHYGISEDDYSIGEFDCSCGANDCLKHFKGFKFMTTQQRNKIKRYISPFLRNKYYQK